MKLKFALYLFLPVFITLGAVLKLKAQSNDSLIRKTETRTDAQKISTFITISKKMENSGKLKGAHKYAKLANNAAEKNAHDSLKVKSLLRLGSTYLSMNNLDSAEICFDQSTALSIKNGFDDYHMYSIVQTATVRIVQAKYSKALLLLKKVETKPDGIYKAYAYNSKGIIFSNLADYSTALEYYMKSLDILKKQNDKDNKYIAGINNNIATVYIYMDDSDAALRHLEDALTLTEGTNLLNVRNSILNNIGNIFLEKNKTDTAGYYFKKAYEVSREMSNPQYKVISLINIANYYLSINQIDKAGDYLNRCNVFVKKYDNITWDIQYKIHRAVYLDKKNQSDSAINMLEDALKTSQKHRLKELSIPIMKRIAQFASENGDYKKAFRYLNEHQIISDSIYNLKKLQIIENLKAIHELDSKEQEIKYLKLENKKKEQQKTNLIFIGFLAVLLLSAVIYILLIRNKSTKQKLLLADEHAKRKELEIKNKDAENEKIKLRLENKEKEIFIKVNQIIQTNELIRVITNKLQKISKSVPSENKKLKKDVQDLLLQIKSQDRKKLWKEFEVRFLNVHKDFYKKLLAKYPKLTPNERKLCAFLKLNMSTKDIASITLQSNNAILVARTRLRKKLDLDSDDNLTAFIQSL